ncbi:MAG: hypothetical protein ACRD2N_25490 [Vicinamibacterales bacterium]
MSRVPRLSVLVFGVFAWTAPVFSSVSVVVVQQTAAPESAKTWLDRRQAMEDYLRTAEVIKMEDIGLGVTKPRRAYLAQGGPFDRMAWKTIKPGYHSGFWESYKSEIAAYELDKFLGLDMIPPTVERKVKNETGAAVMWVASAKSFKDLGGPPTAPPAQVGAWSRQLVRAKMFDNLICNIDPNLGNWLVDPAWNLVLIDHTRSFTTKKDVPHEVTRIDRELWNRMKALSVETLTPVLGKWIGEKEIRAIIERRDRLQGIIDKLVSSKGEAAIFLP